MTSESVSRAGRPALGGMVFVHGELWRALPEKAEEALTLGTEVEVVGFRRTAIVVRRAKNG